MLLKNLKNSSLGKDFLDFTTGKLIVRCADTRFEKWSEDYRIIAEQQAQKTVIYCDKGSQAEKFFKKMGFPVKYMK